MPWGLCCPDVRHEGIDIFYDVFVGCSRRANRLAVEFRQAEQEGETNLLEADLLAQPKRRGQEHAPSMAGNSQRVPPQIAVAAIAPRMLKRISSKLEIDFCEPEDIAAAIAYLASDEARYATGTVLAIDSGQTAG